MNQTEAISGSSRSARVRLYFDQTSDEQFLVLAEMMASTSPGKASQFSVHTFEHEDRFLERLVAAELPLDDTSLLAGTVIRAVDEVGTSRNWMEVSLTDDQIEVLGLKGEPPFRQPHTPSLFREQPPFQFADSSGQFYEFLMQSPTPFVMLSGPDHRITFINQPYVDLIGQTSQRDVLMKTVREVLPELEGQPFFRWLDEVYKTGVARTGKEQIAHIRRQHSDGFEDRYFDFVYCPVRDVKGNVYGVMVQAADVTEKVRVEEVSRYREEALFRQWAELDSIYRTAPVGIALLDAKSFRLLRVNERQAEMVGAPVGDLLGKKAQDLELIPPKLRELFERVSRGETVRDAVVETSLHSDASGHRTWLVNISPFLSATGETLAFTSISLELPGQPEAA